MVNRYNERTTIVEDQFIFALEVLAEHYSQLTKEEEELIKKIANRFEYVGS